ncbi:MAG: hypothetical protein ACLQPD_27915 [Desulfomonilaceae bacterium]
MSMTLEESIKKRIDSPEKRARFEDAGKRIDVGLKIFELREHYGLSEEALAVILGVSREDVESLEGADFTESPHEILDWVCDKLADWSKGQPLSFEDLKSDTRNDYLKRTCT